MRLRVACIFVIIVLFFTWLGVCPSFGSNGDSVIVIEWDGVINFAASELIKEGIDEAHKINAKAVVLILDTPGGLLDATFKIIDLIERSPIPVISFVYPKGATAWSAGTFIVLSSHIAAMTPFSILGSCAPRAYPTGELIQDPKLTNSLTEFIIQRAEMHGRNETIAAKFVMENLNIGAEDAKNYGVIEKVATTLEELLDVVDGIHVEVAEKRQLTIQTKNAAIHYFGASIRVRVLRLISDPMIAYLLFTLGIYGVIFGFFTAGYEGEIMGCFLLILGLIGLGFYVDLLPVVLIAIGGVLIFVEIREPGLEFFGPVGISCLSVGTLLLLRFDPSRWLISPEWYQPFMFTVVALVAILSVFSTLVLYKIFKVRKKRPTTLNFIDGVGRTIDEIGPEKIGFIRFHGEYWKARSDMIIKPNHKVKVLAKEGLTLTVKPIEEEIVTVESEKNNPRRDATL
ncbi:MAG: nodulation protein NfeD [Candidatus Bathyarchaeota archaeon]|nr:MAG: nodulation protein NfeD [Candidatus Bathyarchaeota archaeon]